MLLLMEEINMKKVWIFMLFSAVLIVGVAALINSTAPVPPTVGSDEALGMTSVTSAAWPSEVLDISFLDKYSESVVIGRVIEILPSRWDTPDGKKPADIMLDFSIYTDVIIKVDKIVKGSTPAILVVRTMGGQVGDDLMFAEDEASFELGENVLLFLTREGTHYRITGWEYGKFSITDDNQAVRLEVPSEYQKIPVEELLNSIKSQ